MTNSPGVFCADCLYLLCVLWVSLALTPSQFLLPVVPGRHACFRLKKAAEILGIVESGKLSDLFDTVLGVKQLMLGNTQPVCPHISQRRISRALPENPGQMRWADKSHGRKLLNGQFLQEMIMDIVDTAANKIMVFLIDSAVVTGHVQKQQRNVMLDHFLAALTLTAVLRVDLPHDPAEDPIGIIDLKGRLHRAGLVGGNTDTNDILMLLDVQHFPVHHIFGVDDHVIGSGKQFPVRHIDLHIAVKDVDKLRVGVHMGVEIPDVAFLVKPFAKYYLGRIRVDSLQILVNF